MFEYCINPHFIAIFAGNYETLPLLWNYTTFIYEISSKL